MSGCVNLPEHQSNAWPWEYGKGQGEPNVPDYASFRAGVAKFGEPPPAVKPVTPIVIDPPVPESRPATALSTKIKPEPSAESSVTADKTVATPDMEFDFRVGEKKSVSDFLRPLDNDIARKVITAFNNGRAPVSLVINIDWSSSQNTSADKAVPYYAVVSANTDSPLMQLSPLQSGAPFSFRYSYQWSIGDYTARHNCPEQYRFPFDKKIRAYAQVNDPKKSTPDARYAVIFILPKGTPVLAARTGTVVRRHPGGTIDILHGDSTIGTYSHLETIARNMTVGKSVTTDDVIGIAGTAENSKDAYMQLAVWRPEPRTNSTLLTSTQEIGFDAVSFPLPFSATASEKGTVLDVSQSVTSGKLPGLQKQLKRKPKADL
jgi:murein DD-endopeptidase MepM/ murein hydrolase activator NlpD